MSEHYPRIRVRAQSGQFLLRDGVSLCFYVPRPHAQISHLAMRSLETYLRAVGPHALSIYPVEDDWAPLDEAGWREIHQEMLHPRFALIRLHDRGPEHAQYRFNYYGRPLGEGFWSTLPGAVCVLECWLPTEFLEQHGPERVRALALEMAAPLPFCSGHVGLAFNGELDAVTVPPELRRYRFRYPGFDIVDLSSFAMHLGARVPGPHWMTFLGQPVLSSLGGAAALRARLQSPGTTVQELDADRAVITLGDRPEAGDIDRGLVLPEYRELARVLEPWTYFEEHLTGNVVYFEELRRWERRFLD